MTILLENIYQAPYEELIEEEFAKKYGMANTRAFLSIDDWQKFAFGEQDKKMLIRTKDIDDYTSGPGLNSTVKDMLIYLRLNISANRNIIRRTHKKTFSNADNIQIGLIWRIAQTLSGEKYYFHSGAGWGCNSICLFSPKRKAGVIILVNETTSQSEVIEIGKKILADLID